MSNPSSPLRIRLLTALLLVATFASGALFGAGLIRWMGWPQHGEPPRPPPPFFFFIRELHLSPDQSRQAEAISERHRPELEAVIRASFPKIRAINDQMESELRELLTPEQRTQLDEIKKRRPPPPPGGPMHPHPHGPPGMEPGFPPPPQGPMGAPPMGPPQR